MESIPSYHWVNAPNTVIQGTDLLKLVISLLHDNAQKNTRYWFFKVTT